MIRQDRILSKVRVGITEAISEEVAHGSQLDIERVEHMMSRSIVARLTTAVLAEQLPPERVSEVITSTHPEAVGQFATVDAPHFATWRDHLKATYWARWWFPSRLVRMPRMVERPVRFVVTMPVECSHRVTVAVRGAWHYPRAAFPIPGVGHPVYVSSSFDAATDWTTEATKPWGDPL